MNKVVLVTGSSSNLGQQIVELLSSQGFTIYAGARNIKDITIQNNNVFPIKLDITSDDNCHLVVKKIIKNEGKIDALVNVAGYSLTGPTLDFSSKDFLSILDTNTVGAFRLIQQVVPQMKKRKSGKVISVTSLSGLIAFPNFGLYSSSKFALEALGLSLGYELKKDGIFVTNIAPGAIKSETDKKTLFKHKTAREKFKFLNIIMPMVTSKQISKRVLNVIESSNPPASIVLGSDTKILYLLQKFMPLSLWNKLQHFVWNRK